ncbi:MAG: hypothetical protein QOK37_3723 [Thermoanaerobaculia bacterium]|jgi:hypothetical protein|nr:hypothetical protein [Thermoanaerobaculia bacterium]
MSAMIRRTIKPAEANSRISAEAATAAARLVYRDRATGRFVILENEHAFHPPTQKRAKRVYARNPRHTNSSAGSSTPERRSAKKQ